MLQRFVIDRNIWGRGFGGSNSSLLSNKMTGDDKMCCLGIYLEQLGVPRESMRGWSTSGEWQDAMKDLTAETAEHFWIMPEPLKSNYEGVRDAAVKVSEDAPWLFTNDFAETDTELAGAMMIVNDDPNITDEEREKRLTEMFAEVGIEVEFIN